MKNYRHININERELIFLYLDQGKSFREIGRLLDRNDRTISREVENNGGVSGYSPSKAQRGYETRRINSKSKKLDDVFLKDFVVVKLNYCRSPEQISGRLKIINPSLSISHETIDKFIYSKDFKDLWYWECIFR